MRIRELAKRIQQLEDDLGGPAAQHVVVGEDILLPTTSLAAPVAVDDIPVAVGLYQLALLLDFDAPDQGDGTPPSIYIHLDGLEVSLQGQINPILMYQGNIGQTRLVVSDLAYISAPGTLEVSMHVESSAALGEVSAVPVTIDRVIVSLLG